MDFISDCHWTGHGGRNLKDPYPEIRALFIQKNWSSRMYRSFYMGLECMFQSVLRTDENQMSGAYQLSYTYRLWKGWRLSYKENKWKLLSIRGMVGLRKISGYTTSVGRIYTTWRPRSLRHQHFTKILDDGKPLPTTWNTWIFGE